jgi:hypothetical protein
MQLVKKFPTFYGIQQFITMSTTTFLRSFVTFCKKLVFYSEESLAPQPNLQDVCSCLFNIFTGTLLDSIHMPIVMWDSWNFFFALFLNWFLTAWS